ncbi:methionyl-tRNA formyltransferase [Haloimpatiens sp. FM7330]|uniref:methionyl-tRNA formyltransferase n=1 Tax=Haloimpatiens sp. FM7330 TaxID=3298610 RepID=UPI003626EB67
MMNIVFMGTPEFSVPSLKALIKEFDVKAVLTQPDKPKGRGKKLSISAVKEVAVEHNIDVYQPVRLRKDPEVIQKLKDINPDFIIVVAFGQILPKEVLEIPKYACINLHASLLPKYRGAAPINAAIMNGEEKSGNTAMLMDVGLDTGDMLLKDEVSIRKNMTAGELHDILMEEGAQLLIKAIKEFKNITPQKQDDSLSCYAPMLDKKMAKIDWNKSSKEINNFIRGLNPWPIAYTQYNDKNMKVYETEIIDKTTDYKPGYIINVSNEGVDVSCGEGILRIKKIQFPGKKVLEVKEFLKGNSLEKDIYLK